MYLQRGNHKAELFHKAKPSEIKQKPLYTEHCQQSTRRETSWSLMEISNLTFNNLEHKAEQKSHRSDILNGPSHLHCLCPSPTYFSLGEILKIQMLSSIIQWVDNWYSKAYGQDGRGRAYPLGPHWGGPAVSQESKGLHPVTSDDQQDRLGSWCLWQKIGKSRKFSDADLPNKLHAE